MRPASSRTRCSRSGVLQMTIDEIETVVVRRRGVMNGVACFRGTRTPASVLGSYILTSSAITQFLADNPGVTRPMVRFAVLKALKLLDEHASEIES
jgi:uncharacterized protein (DUF433 family)